MTEFKNIDGHYYPSVHGGWGGFAEELFHYTSRYYATTEAFLRNLADDAAAVEVGSGYLDCAQRGGARVLREDDEIGATATPLRRVVPARRSSSSLAPWVLPNNRQPRRRK